MRKTILYTMLLVAAAGSAQAADKATTSMSEPSPATYERLIQDRFRTSAVAVGAAENQLFDCRAPGKDHDLLVANRELEQMKHVIERWGATAEGLNRISTHQNAVMFRLGNAMRECTEASPRGEASFDGSIVVPGDTYLGDCSDIAPYFMAGEVGEIVSGCQKHPSSSR